VAIQVVADARAGGIAPALVDDDLADRLRRLQLLKRVPTDSASAAFLLRLWQDDPESALSQAARRALHRRRAALNLQANLRGQCHAILDAEGTGSRIDFLTRAVARAPAEANQEMARVGQALAGSTVVQVRCEEGAVAMLLVREDHWRVVDVFAVKTIDVAPLSLRPQSPR
jgi:hypothetical protein